ncbi:MAG: D-2-hydroxyacid dehydrogenase [Lachnospiraceae bacterium]|nr:D-2-hydroxyacid dehydrogenase [Lachnospiraceae bacterium]
MRKLVVSYGPLNEGHRKTIKDTAEKYGFSAAFCDEQDVAEKEAEDAEIIFSLNSKLAQAQKAAKWICTPSAGVDHFLPYVAGTDVMLSNSSGAYGVTIAEHIVVVTLEMMRRRSEYREFVRNRQWRNDLPITSIQGARVTFLGTGDIGCEAAKRIRAFGPKSMTGVNRRGANPDDMFDTVVTMEKLDEILPETDLLIMSLPSTGRTRGIMNKERLSKLPGSAYIVNVGRGDAIDQQTLEAMLREGTLAGAALDVLEKEPLDPESTLWDCPRLVLTTHVAGNWTLPYTVDRIVEMFIEDFENYCNDRPLIRLVDTEAGY